MRFTYVRFVAIFSGIAKSKLLTELPLTCEVGPLKQHCWV